ncbi:MAG TPA: Ig-like domain-containing protein [Gemmatimonadales bacterium]|nr:Ig-like domain-containing protein [Gemmatimonadales bacterium]
MVRPSNRRRLTTSLRGLSALACGAAAVALIVIACKGGEITNGLLPPPRVPPVTGPAEIRPISGGGQSAPIGSLLPVRLVARVYDSTGIPVPGVSISWSANKGGDLSPAGTVTDSDGNAITAWTLGDTVGAQTAVVTSLVGNAAFTSTGTRTLVRIILQPSVVTLAPGLDQQFTATGVYNDSTSRAATVDYSVSPANCGAIGTDGLFTAGASPGTCRVIATQTSGGKLADTSVVNIINAGMTLTSIIIAPASASVPIGQSQTFTVTGKMTDGSTVVPNVTWTTTGGSIGASSGVYAPPGTTGNFKVFAVQVGGTLADTANVSVTAALPQDNAVPVFRPGLDNMAWNDNLDRYYSLQDMQWSIGECGATLPDGHAATNYGKRTTPNNASACATPYANYLLIAPGRDSAGGPGVGKALRAVVHADPNHQQQSVAWLSPWTPNSLSYSGRALVIEVWFRISAGGTPGSMGMKWLEAWFSTGAAQRVQWAPDLGTNTRPLWAIVLGSNPGGPVIRTKQPIGPYWDQINDGKWHKATHLFIANTSSDYRKSGGGNNSATEIYSGTSSRDGRVAMWIDGKKIMDYSQATVGITPPGGTGIWCTQGDVDMIPGLSGGNSIGRIANLQFPGVFNGSPVDWTLDHDDIAIWAPVP